MTTIKSIEASNASPIGYIPIPINTIESIDTIKQIIIGTNTYLSSTCTPADVVRLLQDDLAWHNFYVNKRHQTQHAIDLIAPLAIFCIQMHFAFKENVQVSSCMYKNVFTIFNRYIRR